MIGISVKDITLFGAGAVRGTRIATKFLEAPLIIPTELAPIPRRAKPAVVGRVQKRIITELPTGERVVKDVFQVVSEKSVVGPGRRIEVTTRFRKLIRRPIFTGEAIKDPKGFEKALKKLIVPGAREEKVFEILRREGVKKREVVLPKLRKAIETGVSQQVKFTPAEEILKSFRVARETLRLQRPISERVITKGKGVTVFKPGKKPRTLFTLTQEIKADPQIVSGVKTRARRQVRFLDIGKIPLKEIRGQPTFRSLVEIEKAFLTKEGFPVTKVSQRGRIKTQFEQLSRVEQLKDLDILDLFRTETVAKRTIPKGRKFIPIPPTKTIVFKGEPLITEFIESPIKVKKIISPKKVRLDTGIDISPGKLKSIVKDFKRVFSPSKSELTLTTKQKAALGLRVADIPVPAPPKPRAIPKVDISSIEVARPRIVGGVGIAGAFNIRGECERSLE